MRRLFVVPPIIATIFLTITAGYLVWAMSQFGYSPGVREDQPELVEPGRSSSSEDPKGGSDSHELGVVPLETDEDMLSLVERIPVGIDYTALTQALPSLSPLEQDAGRTLTEAFLSLDIFGFPFEVEFNFQDRRLYGFFYTYGPVADPDRVSEVVNTFRAYYGARYGGPRHESIQEEDGYRVESDYWDSGETQVKLSRIFSAYLQVVTLSMERD